MVGGPAQYGTTAPTLRCTKGDGKPAVSRRMPGAGLSLWRSGKAPPDRPAFQPYWGKPAVRNERGDRGNVGIMRSPVRASILPDSRWSCGGAVHGRAWTTSRAGFLVGCGHEAESLDIAEPAGKRVLDQARRQRRRPAPATDPQKREHLRLRPRGQQDKQRAADLDQVQPAQERSAAPLPHRAQAVRQLERGE